MWWTGSTFKSIIKHSTAESHPTGLFNLNERLYEKKLTLCPSQELIVALTHVLIVVDRVGAAGRARVCSYFEKSCRTKCTLDNPGR